ncbi:DnaJ-related protein rsp1 [Colletotrichum orbiculare MAFF 240422]|uniref:DnaJ-related protein rsp1 n=1 Tax=Colletotrichum orbiculare (strain 104-T / ATCC 96160 / CBS 514.97 / LARS 414 / MAFF 240422) TaxID=1213857 RepID=A0A484G6P2_COLOR|nr:DnaJ-related protein rsp1 [Colletotrichum orbiculare MAFF 240422]
MVGVDMTRDYYADLELSAGADVNDIKKQFRKLALKYHPDRNPGREAEVNSKFQLIQSAHEILTDPDSRAKYDAGRTRSRYPTASGVRGNPWQNAGANFPPPPRRNATSRNPPPPPPPSGASRYRNFASGAAPTAKAQQQSDPEAKRSAWHAFESMKSKGNQSQPKTKAESPPEPPKRPVPRTPSQKQRAEASFGRKSGYVPHSPAPMDEPPVNASNYSTTNRHSNIFSENSHRQGVPDPLAQFREAYTDSRQSTPYSAHGGEKTNPFDGVPLGRAKSNRESPREPQQASYGPNLSPGSAHHKRAQSVPRQARTEPSSPRTSTPQDDRPNSATANAANSPKDPFRSKASARYTPPNVASGFAQDSGPAKQPTSAEGQARSTGTPKASSIFNFPIDDDTFERTEPRQPSFSRRSTNDINTSFVNNEGSEAFQFSAGSPVHESTIRSQSGSRSSRSFALGGSEEENEWRGRKATAEPVGAKSPNAMDIDPPHAGVAQTAAQSNGVRNIPVEPSRPEWRPGNVDGVNGTAPKPAPLKPTFNANAAGSEDSEEFRANFAELKNVAPFADSASGLGSLGDLKMNLPFESQASSRIPIEKEKSKPTLDFPITPVAPRPPPTFAVGLKPTGGAWQKYVQDFQSYVLRWEIFNAQVIEHFNARKTQVADLRARNGYRFLASRGDEELHEYLEWMQQDKDVRRKWAIACEDHEARIREFMVYKAKMR